MDERTFEPVTVGKLVKLLNMFPSEMRVMVRGYESGFDDPRPLSVVRVQVDDLESSVYGDYETAKFPDGFDAVLIDRK